MKDWIDFGLTRDWQCPLDFFAESGAEIAWAHRRTSKTFSQKVLRKEGVESEAKSLQQAGIVRDEHNPGLKKEKFSGS